MHAGVKADTPFHAKSTGFATERIRSMEMIAYSICCA